jgi:cysteinyl-tRNA synthetase
MIKIYNTLTRRIEEFTPLKKGKLSMYACGVTTYDEIHIGHARQAVIFDLIKNYFTYLGYKVTYVRNYTDIDDKIINKANKENKSAKEVSEYYIEESKKDLKNLKVKEADYEPKVTECIPDIISYIEQLIASGNAYVSNGEVFFDVESFKGYGKLSNRKIDELTSGEDQMNKKRSNDFSLWKPAKPGEPSWDSPWGAGRPGWHIECSVMVNKYLGETIDIHGGGVDLIFPHHENEIAQSESHNKKKFANYWVHNGLVMVNGIKMSKSLGNFMTVKDALKKYYPEEIRYAILSQHYLSEIDFTDELFLNSKKRMYYFYKTLARIDKLLKENRGTNSPVEISDIIENLESDFKDAMDDGFNTAKVFANLSGAFSVVNQVLTSAKYAEGDKAAIVSRFRDRLKILSEVMHILEEDPAGYVQKLENDILSKNNITVEFIESAIRERREAKMRKEYDEADHIRKKLLEKNISLMDAKDAVEWEVVI